MNWALHLCLWLLTWNTPLEELEIIMNCALHLCLWLLTWNTTLEELEIIQHVSLIYFENISHACVLGKTSKKKKFDICQTPPDPPLVTRKKNTPKIVPLKITF